MSILNNEASNKRNPFLYTFSTPLPHDIYQKTKRIQNKRDKKYNMISEISYKNDFVIYKNLQSSSALFLNHGIFAYYESRIWRATLGVI